ncbi:MAG TPA: hypothetical protein VNZ03_21110 [Terriglobales bacterium]|jgi:hypothetical protein|nr:hypothetical protein [Terriglobales bacterium]
MRKLRIALALGFLLFAAACSPRDFLTRRLASDLIASSDTFKSTQLFWLRTGVISNKDYVSPEYLVLQRRGWITGTTDRCPPDIAPPPCWQVTLTPIGVETFHDLIPNGANSQYFSVPVARRQLTRITGISKSGAAAEVEFLWKWISLNEVGGALYDGGVQYRSTVAFRRYDDGWRVVEGSAAKSTQGLEDALKSSEPAP